MDPIGVNGGINVYNSVSNQMVNGFAGQFGFANGGLLNVGDFGGYNLVDPYGLNWWSNVKSFAKGAAVGAAVGAVAAAGIAAVGAVSAVAATTLAAGAIVGGLAGLAYEGYQLGRLRGAEELYGLDLNTDERIAFTGGNILGAVVGARVTGWLCTGKTSNSTSGKDLISAHRDVRLPDGRIISGNRVGRPTSGMSRNQTFRDNETGLGIGKNSTTAVAEVRVKGLPRELLAYSDKKRAVGGQHDRFHRNNPNSRIVTNQLENTQRPTDAESRIIAYLRSQITDTNTTGKITIYVDPAAKANKGAGGVCRFCKQAIKNFQDEYQNIELKVISSN